MAITTEEKGKKESNAETAKGSDVHIHVECTNTLKRNYKSYVVKWSDDDSKSVT